MADTIPHFHKVALDTVLFKGRVDAYFCFLKAEKIAHVLSVLADSAAADAKGQLHTLCHDAALLPASIARSAAGDTEQGSVLAQLFALLSMVHLADTQGVLARQTAQIIATEYEGLIARFSSSLRVSPFVSAADFALPELPHADAPLGLRVSDRLSATVSQNGNADAEHKRHIRDTRSVEQSTPPGHARPAGLVTKEQQARLEKIQKVVFEKGRVSIKDISAVVRGCSEKTIQRELSVLISRGVVQKVGERRWSVYMPTMGVSTRGTQVD